MTEGKNCSEGKCSCSQCLLSSMKGRNHTNIDIISSYLDFAKECLAYQDLVHQQEVPACETFLSQIRNYDSGRRNVNKRNLDSVFENFIKNYSRYVLKDTFDLGIKKSYYAVHKKVEAVLKERHIPPAKEDDTTIKLIEAYREEKNKLLAKKSRSTGKIGLSMNTGNNAKLRAKQSLEEKTTPLDRMETQATVTADHTRQHKYFLDRLKLPPRESSTPLDFNDGNISEDGCRPRQMRRTFMELKRRKLWREMQVAALKKMQLKSAGKF